MLGRTTGTTGSLVTLIPTRASDMASSLLSGQENDEYIGPGPSFLTLFLTVLGEYDLDRMLAVNPIFGYIFFMAYQVCEGRTFTASYRPSFMDPSFATSNPPSYASLSCYPPLVTSSATPRSSSSS